MEVIRSFWKLWTCTHSSSTYQSLRIQLIQNAPDDGPMRSETCRANKKVLNKTYSLRPHCVSCWTAYTYIQTDRHRTNPYTVPPDKAPPSRYGHDSLWIRTPFHAVFSFTATLYITPQCAANKQYLFWLCIHKAIAAGWTVWGLKPVGLEVFRTRPDRLRDLPASCTLGLTRFSCRKNARGWRWPPHLVPRSWMVRPIPLTPPHFQLTKCERLFTLINSFIRMCGFGEL